MWWLSISEIDSSVSSNRKKLSYRKHVHHNPSIRYASTDVERRESGSMFCETKHFLKFERIEQKAWKHSAEKYHDQTMKFTPFYPWICLHHIFALDNLIFSDVWRVLTWQYCQNQITASDSMQTRTSLTQSHYISILGKAITSFLGYNNKSSTKRDFFKYIT